MVLRLITAIRTVPIVSIHLPNSQLTTHGLRFGAHDHRDVNCELCSATLVGATENVNPEKGAALSAGGFSNYFARPSWREFLSLPPFPTIPPFAGSIEFTGMTLWWRMLLT